MNETTQMLLDAAQRVFERNFDEKARHRAEDGEWLAEGWAAIAEFGAPLALLSEEDGGFGLSAADAFALVRLAAASAVPMPIGETMLGNWLLSRAGLPITDGPLAIAPCEPGDRFMISGDGDGWHVQGQARNVPWGPVAEAVLVAAQAGERAYLVRIDRRFLDMVPGRTMASHPRADLQIDLRVAADAVAPLPEGLDGDAILAAGAALRAVAMAGALERVLDLTVDYANERVQFGRAIGKFQAVQQNIARLAGKPPPPMAQPRSRRRASTGTSMRCPSA